MEKKFINCSNHPSTKWSEFQLNTAKTLGEVVDVPFPSVEPELDEEGIKTLAESVISQIKEAAGASDITVHIMGEMCLTFAVVCELMAMGIPCVASTTRHIAKEMPDGTKISQFEFVQFRRY